MQRNWLRRAFLALALVSSGWLTACGSSSVESSLVPTRFVAFGDGFSDLGQTGTRYTVNDDTVNVWTQRVAERYGLTLTTQAEAGLSYARGNARISAKPDAAGNASTLTVVEQIDSFLASNSIGANDVILIGGGFSDIVVQMAAFRAGTQTSEAVLANVRQAGRVLGEQVRRLVAAGARYVVVTGAYNLGRSPWALSITQTSLLEQASQTFNQEMLVTVFDLGNNVFYVDSALYYNLITASPSGFGLTNVVDAACNSVDAGPGIGIGTGQVNSALCTPDTLAEGVVASTYGFADLIYPTPQAHRLFGDYAFDRIRARW
jgi:outer membrane lipase/esterase